EGARIAQVGSPSEITEAPASDFVATFIGVERGTRALRAKQTERGTVLVDAAGRTQGVLVEGGA
ncbi:MAG: ABC transporter ATP-binding protein, partial [Actinomycetota bacterium]|nr:ABC transporter ATP-binding protein [Actinomycetota bacterium]